MAILEKIFEVLQFIAHYVWAAIKAVAHFLIWLISGILMLISNLITWIRYNLSPRAQLILVAIIVALLVVGGALIFTGHGCTPGEDPGKPSTQAPPEVSYTINEADVQDVSYAPGTISSFSLVKSGNQMYPELSDEDNQAITDALSYFKDKDEKVGFMIVNLNTGSGYCYDIDSKIYGASTYKAPISTFICESWVDQRGNSLSKVKDRIENAIIWSDNNSYRSLKRNFDGDTHNAWLSSMGISPSGYSATFPTYSVRDSATIWMHIYEYINSGTDTANWLKTQLGNTEVSFLRDGVMQAGLSNAKVYNKAGWCASKSGVEDAVNDAGIVIDGDQTYLVVAFSSMRDSEPAEAALSDLFEALLRVRGNLDSSAATWDNVETVTADSQDKNSSKVQVTNDAEYEIAISEAA